METYCIRVLLHQPHLLAALDQALRRVELEPLAPDDFAILEHQEILRALRAGATTPDALRGRLDSILHPHLEKLWAEPPSQAEPQAGDDQKALRALFDATLRMREVRLKARLTELRFLQEDAASQNDRDALREYHAVTQSVAKLLHLTQVKSRRVENGQGETNRIGTH
jgi:hypothetical protein